MIPKYHVFCLLDGHLGSTIINTLKYIQTFFWGYINFTTFKLDFLKP